MPTSLAPGDQYRLAFVTSGSYSYPSPDRSDIALFNQFVTSAANLVQELFDLGTTWNAIASTPFVDARDNTGTNPSTDGAGVPIFLLNDTQLVDSNDDLWDGSLDRALSVDERLNSFRRRVWTGTTESGTGVVDGELGAESGHVMSGLSDNSDSWWVAHSLQLFTNSNSLYALSSTLTVPTSTPIPEPPIPEPSTLVLFGLGFLGFVGYVYRRKRRLSD